MKKLQISFDLGTGPPNPINFNAGFFLTLKHMGVFFSPLKMQEGVENRRNMDLQQPVLLGEVLAKKKHTKNQPLMEAPSNDAFRKATP